MQMYLSHFQEFLLPGPNPPLMETAILLAHLAANILYNTLTLQTEV